MSLISGSSLVTDQETYLRKVSPFSFYFSYFWEQEIFSALPLVIIYIALVFPELGFILPIVGLIVAFANYKSPRRFPAFTPQSSNERIDPNLILPGKEKEKGKPNGITCVGVCRRTNVQIFLNADYDKRHHATIATTGAGKTFGLMFKVLMSLVQTTGTVIIDGKGAEDFPKAVWSMLRRFGREKDFLLLNFKQSGKDTYEKNTLPTSNTFAPFIKAPRSAISEMLKSLLSQDDESAGKGDFWAQRANVFVDMIAALATYNRDHFGTSLSVNYFRELSELRTLIKIYTDERIPEPFKRGLRSYFDSVQIDTKDIPGYAAGDDFKGKIVEQHSYVSMQLQPALSVLADDYGYIFDTDNPDIDMEDVATNNRVLFVLLPSLQKSPATTQNTGRIALAALKGMIASHLGEDFEGNLVAQESARPMKDAAPFHVRLDESGYYAAINGIQILPAQARGIGFSFDFIAQTFLDWQAAGGKVAEIIWGNTNNKQIGKIEDDETFEKINKRIGKRVVIEQNTIQEQVNFLGLVERSAPGQLTVQQKDAVEFKDFTKLREGQFKQVLDDKTFDIRVGDPLIKNPVKEIRMNHYCALAAYKPEELDLDPTKFDYSRIKKGFSTNLSNPSSKISKRIPLPSQLSTVLAKAQRVKATQGSYLSIDQWQLALFNIAADKRRADEESAADTLDAALAFAASKKRSSKGPSKKNSENPPKLSDESQDWFNSATGALDVDTDNQPSQSAAITAWKEYRVDLEGEASTSDHTDSYDDVLDVFANDLGKTIDEGHTSTYDDSEASELNKEDNEHSTSADFDIPEESKDEPSTIDEALDQVGFSFDDAIESIDVNDDTGREEQSGDDTPPHQLEFPGVNFDGQPAKKVAADYPPKNETTSHKGIKEIVRENIGRVSDLLDIEL